MLTWIIDRCEDRIGANETPIGFLPRAEDLNTEGLDLDPGTLDALLSVDHQAWKAELDSLDEYFKEFGSKLPELLIAERDKVAAALDG